MPEFESAVSRKRALLAQRSAVAEGLAVVVKDLPGIVTYRRADVAYLDATRQAARVRKEVQAELPALRSWVLTMNARSRDVIIGALLVLAAAGYAVAEGFRVVAAGVAILSLVPAVMAIGLAVPLNGELAVVDAELNLCRAEADLFSKRRLWLRSAARLFPVLARSIVGPAPLYEGYPPYCRGRVMTHEQWQQAYSLCEPASAYTVAKSLDQLRAAASATPARWLQTAARSEVVRPGWPARTVRIGRVLFTCAAVLSGAGVVTSLVHLNLAAVVLSFGAGLALLVRWSVMTMHLQEKRRIVAGGNLLRATVALTKDAQQMAHDDLAQLLTHFDAGTPVQLPRGDVRDAAIETVLSRRLNDVLESVDELIGRIGPAAFIDLRNIDSERRPDRKAG